MSKTKDYMRIFKFIEGNKGVPFIKKIIANKFKKDGLVQEEYKRKFIVYPGKFTKADAI